MKTGSNFWTCWCALFLVACQSEECHLNYKKTDTPTANILRIGSDKGVSILDPRFVEDLTDLTAVHLLQEGLMRIEADGEIKNALAQSVTISPDKKRYTFQLRPAKWSNGDPITAHDFVYTWKSILEPNFKVPHADQLFILKEGRAAKEERAFLEEVDVFAQTATTLVVELEKPVPYFLELLATSFYFPVNATWAETQERSSIPPSSGPFIVENWQPKGNLTVIKNPLYWDATSVTLEKAALVVAATEKALELFQKDELDWIGAPLNALPVPMLANLQKQGCLQTAPAAGAVWLLFNATVFPFREAILRQAFVQAIDRTALAKVPIQGHYTLAEGILPKSLGLLPLALEPYHPSQAQLLENQALTALNLKKLPPVALCYTQENHSLALALQQEWQRLLKAQVTLQECQLPIPQTAQMFLLTTFAPILNPLHWLQNLQNQSNMPSHQVENLLDTAAFLGDDTTRQQILSQAEEKLLASLLIAPLFEIAFDYMAKSHIQGVYLSPTGYLDCKHAKIQGL